jgi:hypothetical protein
MPSMARSRQVRFSALVATVLSAVFSSFPSSAAWVGGCAQNNITSVGPPWPSAWFCNIDDCQVGDVITVYVWTASTFNVDGEAQCPLGDTVAKCGPRQFACIDAGRTTSAGTGRCIGRIHGGPATYSFRCRVWRPDGGGGRAPGGRGGTFSPNLGGGSPCHVGGPSVPPGDAIQQWLGVAVNSSYPCGGSIYGGSVNAGDIVIAGFDAANGTPYEIVAQGSLTGAYTYVQPCVSGQSVQFEAKGSLQLNSTAAVGTYGAIPITSVQISSQFWWSSFEASGLVATRGVHIVLNGGAIVVDDSHAESLGPILTLMAQLPNCSAPSVPSPGNMNVFFQTVDYSTMDLIP